MKHKKRSKKKMLSTFTASAILTTSLLPGVQMVHAEEKVAQEKQVQSSGFQTIDGKTYYFGQKNDGTGLAEGEMAIWTVNINGKPHYFSGDGSAWAANSWLADYHQDGAPNTWYILEKGEKASGFKQIDGKWYYFDPNNDYRMASGFLTIDGKTYYFDPNNNNKMATGWEEIDGKWYYLSKKGDGLSSLVEGEMASGFLTIDGKTYYFGQKHDETGLTEGEMAIWTVKINEKPHYFSGDGSARAANSWLADYHQDSAPKTWYILEKGEMASGFKQIDGKWYYFDPNNDYRMASGFLTIDGKTYYFDPNNDYRMAKDWFQVGEDWYRANEDGALNKGTLDWRSDNYFFDEKTGKNLGSMKKMENAYYGYGPGKDAKLLQGFHEFDGKTYYFGKKDDGTGLAEGEKAIWTVNINGKSHYFSGDGSAWAANSWLA
ncbi:hypothetical protein ACIQ48_29540, partial [Bacillus mycoides]